MLTRGALAAVIVGAGLVLAWTMWPRGAGESESESREGESQAEVEREVERESESESEVEVEREVESESEVEREVEVEPETPSQRAERQLADLRQQVHVLEMQRLDARDRGDHATEERLDREIAAARAEHDRLRGVDGEPEGI